MAVGQAGHALEGHEAVVGVAQPLIACRHGLHLVLGLIHHGEAHPGSAAGGVVVEQGAAEQVEAAGLEGVLHELLPLTGRGAAGRAAGGGSGPAGLPAEISGALGAVTLRGGGLAGLSAKIHIFPHAGIVVHCNILPLKFCFGSILQYQCHVKR